MAEGGVEAPSHSAALAWLVLEGDLDSVYGQRMAVLVAAVVVVVELLEGLHQQAVTVTLHLLQVLQCWWEVLHEGCCYKQCYSETLHKDETGKQGREARQRSKAEKQGREARQRSKAEKQGREARQRSKAEKQGREARQRSKAAPHVDGEVLLL